MIGTAPADTQAMEIYQDLLDRICAAYEKNDFDALTAMIHVPHKVSGFGPVVPINTLSELRAVFDGVWAYFERARVTQYDRVCLAAQFNGPDAICGVHETRIVSGTQLLEQPYPVKSELRQIDGGWKVCESDKAFDPDHGLGHVFNQFSAGKLGK